MAIESANPNRGLRVINEKKYVFYILYIYTLFNKALICYNSYYLMSFS